MCARLYAHVQICTHVHLRRHTPCATRTTRHAFTHTSTRTRTCTRAHAHAHVHTHAKPYAHARACVATWHRMCAGRLWKTSLLGALTGDAPRTSTRTTRSAQMTRRRRSARWPNARLFVRRTLASGAVFLRCSHPHALASLSHQCMSAASTCIDHLPR